MKRIIGIIVLMGISALTAFAEGQPESAAGGSASAGKNSIMALGIGFNQTNYTLGYDIEPVDYTEKIKVPSFDINMTGYTTSKSDPFTFGFLYDMNLLISSSPTYEEDDAGTIYTENLGDFEGYGAGFGLQAILGPGFNADLGSGLSLQMGLGAHFALGLMPSDLFVNDDLFGFGLGIGNITRLNLEFAEGMGLMFGLDIAFDFLSLVDGYDIDPLASASGSTFSISPLILVSFSNFGSSRTGSVASSGKSGSSGSGSSSSSEGIIGGALGGGSSNGSRTRTPSKDEPKEWDSDPYD